MHINPDKEIQALRDNVTQKEGLGIKVDYMAALRRLTSLQYFRDHWMTCLRVAGGRASFGIECGARVYIGGDLTLQLVEPIPDWKEYAGDFHFDA